MAKYGTTTVIQILEIPGLTEKLAYHQLKLRNQGKLKDYKRIKPALMKDISK